MAGSERLWNGKPRGVPRFALDAAVAVVGRLLDAVSAWLWNGGLGSTGSGARVQRGVTVRYPGHVTLGRNVRIGRRCTLDCEFPDSRLVIGDDSQLNQRVELDFSGGVDISSNVVVSEGVRIFTHSHGHDPHSEAVKTPLRIEQDVWIGAGAIIVEGVGVIGRGSVVAAGAVVTGPVPPRTVVGGIPARPLKQTSRGQD